MNKKLSRKIKLVKFVGYATKNTIRIGKIALALRRIKKNKSK
ncbi:MAG: hypothetical protein Q4D95_02880 [Peptoniphilus sp.]|nr:hypothetical protein [Peptoniphilus sp.]